MLHASCSAEDALGPHAVLPTPSRFSVGQSPQVPGPVSAVTLGQVHAREVGGAWPLFRVLPLPVLVHTARLLGSHPLPWGHTGLCEPHLLVAPGRLSPEPITKPWAHRSTAKCWAGPGAAGVTLGRGRRVSTVWSLCPGTPGARLGLQIGNMSDRVAVTVAWGLCRF